MKKRSSRGMGSRQASCLVLILLTMASISNCMMNINTLLHLPGALTTNQKMAKLPEKIPTTYAKQVPKEGETEMTPEQFKKFLAEKTEKKIEEIDKAFKLQ
jgi:hypothetical protein